MAPIPPPRRWREQFVLWALGLTLALLAFFFLLLVGGGLFLAMLAAAAGLAGFIGLHYLLWGRLTRRGTGLGDGSRRDVPHLP